MLGDGKESVGEMLPVVLLNEVSTDETLEEGIRRLGEEEEKQWPDCKEVK